ncbi:MAG: DNA-binding protein [Christensenellaceae bacterium]|nr:DNA-binding protein [Christensenellaceae bacterium]MDY2850819.1 sigma factor-like helix-turn-helix DNA-binding protein [Christensenellaceae bacterium]
MEKDFELTGLFGLYGNLLTEHQKELFDLYYGCDLSLGEIAEIKKISRQSVNDGLKKAKEVLFETEEKLGLYKKISLIKTETEKARDCGDYKSAVNNIKSLLEEV